MGRLSEKQLLLVTVGAGILLVLGCGVMIYWLHTERAAVLDEIVKLDEKLADRARKEKESAEIQAEFDTDTRKAEEAHFDKQLPLEKKDSGDTEFVTYLNRQRGGLPILIRKVEAVVERAGTGGFTPPKDVRKMAYRVEMRGRFYDILEYLSAIENDDRIVRIEHFLFKRKQSTGGDQEAGETVVDATVRFIGFEYQVASGAAPKP